MAVFIQLQKDRLSPSRSLHELETFPLLSFAAHMITKWNVLRCCENKKRNIQTAVLWVVKPMHRQRCVPHTISFQHLPPQKLLFLSRITYFRILISESTRREFWYVFFISSRSDCSQWGPLVFFFSTFQFLSWTIVGNLVKWLGFECVDCIKMERSANSCVVLWKIWT